MLTTGLPILFGEGNSSGTGIEIQSDIASPSTVTSSNGGILLQGGNDVFLQGVQVDAGKDVSIKGGSVVIQAATNSQSVRGATRSKSPWYDFRHAAVLLDAAEGINAREQTSTRIDDTRLARTDISGANVNITATDTLALAGTTIDAPGKVTLQADTLIMGTQASEQTTHVTSQGRDLVYQIARDNGHTDQTTGYNQINAGNLAVDVNHVQAGLGARDSIEALARQPGMGWVQQLINDPSFNGKVDWAKIEEVHKTWDNGHQGLTPEGAAIVTVVVAYFTAGAASGLGAALGDAVSTAGVAAMGEGGLIAAGGLTVSTAVSGAPSPRAIARPGSRSDSISTQPSDLPCPSVSQSPLARSSRRSGRRPSHDSAPSCGSNLRGQRVSSAPPQRVAASQTTRMPCHRHGPGATLPGRH
jgi:filamentous hemagglutinin